MNSIIEIIARWQAGLEETHTKSLINHLLLPDGSMAWKFSGETEETLNPGNWCLAPKISCDRLILFSYIECWKHWDKYHMISLLVESKIWYKRTYQLSLNCWVWVSPPAFSNCVALGHYLISVVISVLNCKMMIQHSCLWRVVRQSSFEKSWILKVEVYCGFGFPLSL